MFDNVHVLIIEDDPTSVNVLERLLTPLGASWTTITDTQNLDQALKDIPLPDVIFLDLEMPKFNGYDVLNVLRNYPDLRDVPIIAYTTHISHMNQVREAGFDGFLGKPIDPIAFADNLSAILNGEEVWEAP